MEREGEKGRGGGGGGRGRRWASVSDHVGDGTWTITNDTTENHHY